MSEETATKCPHCQTELENRRALSVPTIGRELSGEPHTLERCRDTLRASLENARNQVARWRDEYEAWIEELEGPTPKELLEKIAQFRDLVLKARDGGASMAGYGFVVEQDVFADLVELADPDGKAPKAGPSALADALHWEDVQDEWSAAIAAAHPTRNGSHHAYAVAMKMVGNRHSKAQLVALVSWLLQEKKAP